jgi:hypothetical protein
MSQPQDKLSGDVSVGLDGIAADLKVQVKSWGAKCVLSCLGSRIVVDFHDDGGVELVERSDQQDPV